VESISINKCKTSYYKYDLLDLSETVINLNHNNGTQSQIFWGDVNLTCNIPSGTEITGATTLTFKYNNDDDLTISEALTVTNPSIDEIILNTTNAATTFYTGGNYSSSGLVANIKYKNGAVKEDQSFTSNGESMLEVNGTIPANYARIEPYTITITVTNPNIPDDIKTATYNVSVTMTGTITSIRLEPNENIDYINFVVGDNFTLSNRLNVITVFADGTETSTNNYTVIPSIGTQIKKAGLFTATISFTTSSGNVLTQTFDFNAVIKHETYKDLKLLYKPAKVNTNDALSPITIIPTRYPSEKIEIDFVNTFPLFECSKITNHNYNGDNVNQDCVGYLIKGNSNENAKVVLFEDYTNVNADGNITVKYPHYVDGYADRINKCRFGKIFNKRLFISGNPNYKNCDWHSSEINNNNNTRTNDNYQSFTYFSDLDYCYYGTDETAIVGYDIYRDGTLVVVKEGSNNEATLYSREYKLTTAIDSSGTEISGLYEEQYPCFDINTNGCDGGLNYRSITNFMGDTIILTHRGLKLLQTKNTTYNNEKIAYDISSYINDKIVNEDLKNAFLSAFRERLFLQTSRGLYIGEYNLRNDNNEYEWYFISDIHADQIFNYDDELYFTTSSGNLFRFTKDNDFKDRNRTFIGRGQALVTYTDEPSGDYITIDNSYGEQIAENDSFYLVSIDDLGNELPIHASLGNYKSSSIQNNMIEISNSKFINEILTAKYVYCDNLNVDSKLEIDTPYLIKEVPTNSFTSSYYKLYDINGIEMDISKTSSLRLSIRLDETMDIKYQKLVGSQSNQIQLLDGFDKVYDLEIYNKDSENRTYTYYGVSTKISNINAYYITKPYDFGTIIYGKTIKAWTIANDTNLNSKVSVSYYSSNKMANYGNAILFNDGNRDIFNNTSFSDITFEKDVLPHIRTTIKVVPNVGFIRFKFFNNGTTNLVLSQLSINYILNNLKGGNR